MIHEVGSLIEIIDGSSVKSAQAPGVYIYIYMYIGPHGMSSKGRVRNPQCSMACHVGGEHRGPA